MLHRISAHGSSIPKLQSGAHRLTILRAYFYTNLGGTLISGLPIYGLELAFQTLFLSGAPKE